MKQNSLKIPEDRSIAKQSKHVLPRALQGTRPRFTYFMRFFKKIQLSVDWQIWDNFLYNLFAFYPFD